MEQKLPELYKKIIDWTHDDEKRYKYEGQLLSYRYELLRVSPENSKSELRKEIYEMASGMVLVNTSSVLAWKITIEWEDKAELADYDPTLLLKFIYKFPQERLSKTLMGYFRSDISPYGPSLLEKDPFTGKNIRSNSVTNSKPKDLAQGELIQDESVEFEDDIGYQTESFSLSFILESLTDGLSDESLLSYRILGAFYIHIREYESASDIGNRGLKLSDTLGKALGTVLTNSINHFRTIVGTAYIFYQAPKNHAQAKSLFNAVLQSNENYIPAKIGKGLIFREAHEYVKAVKLLKVVHEELPDNLEVLFEYSWCLVLTGKYKEGREGMFTFLEAKVGDDPLSQDYRAQAWWRIGQSYWKKLEDEEEKFAKGTSKRDSKKLKEFVTENYEHIFDSYAKSLKENPNFAPAYSSLGKFYDKQGDTVRSTKCYYKAFELDGGDLDAAEELAKDFANKGDWNLVSIVASRVLESERVRFMGNIKSLTWPTRVLGIASLNNQNFGAAVRYFQDSLRKDPNDNASWIGLGEAYLNSGSYDSAKKVFSRAQQLDPNNWIATFHYAMVLRKTKEFDEAVNVLKGIASRHPKETAPKMALIETLLLSARSHYSKEIFTQSVGLAVECVETAGKAILEEDFPMTQDIWRAIGQCCEIFLSVRSNIDMVPLELLRKLASYSKSFDGDEDLSTISIIDEITFDTIEYSVSLSAVKQTVIYSILFFKLALYFSRKDRSSRAVGWYNLGLASLKSYLLTYNLFTEAERKKQLYASMESLKHSIRIFNTNPEIWNAYGVACSFINSKVAQHSFIRSLSLDMHQSSPLINLAALYLRQDDLQLAEEAVQRALATDPEFSPAWIGKGIIQYTWAKSVEARNTFQQAFEISNGNEKLSKLYYALTVFEMIQNKYKFISKGDTKSENKLDLELETSVMSLQKYLKLVPDSPLAINLSGLIFERVSNYEESMKFCTKLCTHYEQIYEEHENQEDLIKFVRAKSHLARVSLGAENFNEAIEHSQFALDVSNDLAEEDELASNMLRRSRLSAFLTSGLGYYFTQKYNEAIECFKHALTESDEDQDVIVLLSQVLWAHGGSDEREVALEQLFGSIEKHGSASLNIALTLGAIGITHDSEIIEAAQDELKGFSPQFLAVEDPENNVPLMLSAMNKAQEKNPALPWLNSAFYQPWNFKIWTRVDDEVAAIEATTRVGAAISANELSNAYIGKRDFSSLQKGVFYSPWNVDSWKALASVF